MKFIISIFFLALFGLCNAVLAPLYCSTPGDDEAISCFTDSSAETEEPVQEANYELNETASVRDAMGGELSLRYPSGWVANTSDGTGVINLIEGGSGQIITVSYFSETVASALGDSPAEVLELMTASLESGLSGAEISEIVETGIDGNEAASLTMTVADLETLYYIVSLDGGYVFSVSTGVEQGLLEAIILTVEYES